MEDDECVGNDVTYIREALGEMPEPTSQVFDIYLQEMTPYNVMPARWLYDNNMGIGYTSDQARIRASDLNSMKVGKLTFVMRLRNMPKTYQDPSTIHFDNGSEIQFRSATEFFGKDENGEFLF
jgi:hypothetical protein